MASLPSPPRVHLFRPGDPPAHVAAWLGEQGFTGRLGQRAVWTDGSVHVAIGVGERPTLESIRDSLRAVGLAHGTDVAADWPAELSSLLGPGLLTRVVAGSLWDLGLRPVELLGDPDDIAWAEIESRAVARAREWTNAAGADLTPERFAAVAHDTAAAGFLECTVFDPGALASGGFGGLLAIGAGSRYGPRLVDLRYSPKNPRAQICLVGKGITFDTGGLSLKSPAAMMPMRMDKVGAATVLAVMSVLHELHLPIAVRGLLALAENMIGPDATRPGDVITSWNGTPVRIMDTDFEGRVVLADALAYGAAGRPDIMIDIAALTYQVSVALGQEIGGVISNDDLLASRVLAAASDVGEAMWPLPLPRRYLDQVNWQDGVKNHPESETGRTLTAALFLSRFVPETVPWAHLDITGPAWRGPASQDGATGFATRTLLRLIASHQSDP